ncbi:MAG: GatB/YqeY domain-containing protein [Ilumatobacteraceae bacterium]
MTSHGREGRAEGRVTAAMKARDEVALSALRQALSAVSVAETAGSELVELGDDQVLAVLAAEAKKHHEAADAFERAGRAEQVASERAEAAVLEAYLPAALSDDELQGDRGRRGGGGRRRRGDGHEGDGTGGERRARTRRPVGRRCADRRS